VPAENIHLTLAFIGAWPVSRIQRLLDVGSRLDGDAMHVVLDTLGGFRRAHVAWIAPSMAPSPVSMLAASLGRLLAGAGIAVDARPFHPHLTLVRNGRGLQAEEAAGPFGWDIDGVALMQSATHAEGARYTMLRRWPLGIGIG
jgi:RNA 2',3'-cyclic 3'-phosphodiesterase